MPGDIKGFREAFIAGMKKYGDVVLSDCTIKVANYRTCDDGSLSMNDELWETIPNDIVLDEEIDVFFAQLLIATEQPNERQMYEYIRDELGDDFNLCDCEFVASSFEHKMLEWFKDKLGKFLEKKDGNEMFAEAKQQLARLVLVGPSLEYGHIVRTANISYQKLFDVNKLLCSAKQVCCVRAQYNTLLTMLRIYPALKKLDNYSKDDAFIVLKGAVCE
jgi:hypothetical protein